MFRDQLTGHYYVKNLAKLAEATKRGYIIALQETRITRRAELIMRKRWNAHFTPNQNTNGRGLGFIYDTKLQKVKFGHHLKNFVAYLSYTLNNHQYVYITIHLYSGSEIHKKIMHLQQINDVIDSIRQNNPNAILLVAGDLNICTE